MENSKPAVPGSGFQGKSGVVGVENRLAVYRNLAETAADFVFAVAAVAVDVLRLQVDRAAAAAGAGGAAGAGVDDDATTGLDAQEVVSVKGLCGGEQEAWQGCSYHCSAR
eukprot:CAMPEP_0175096012 /NCGR_PEP_ID=MMETSP0086_2-20121207/4491_1 /TAXON_ID=136419 /ORGANISM="Unknown Unknown, Strain D1" /LENGTH=109 /DNA_ID=CAMNT_0016369357 /DNA_START=390 /DNA_END=720 /DNA_ORIENTATION=-